MVKTDKSRKKASLIKDNAILFALTFVGSTFGYLFHFIAARFLGPINYGILGALLSILYILTIPFNTIQTTIARFTSKFKSMNEEGKIAYLIKRSVKKMFIISILLSALIIALIPVLKSFLFITATAPFVVLSLVAIFIFLLPIVRGVMQGLQNFRLLGLNVMLEGFLKFSVGASLILAGLAVNGAIGAIIASFAIPFIIGIYNLRKYFRIKQVKIKKDNIYAYTATLLVLLSALTLFYSADLLLVKHYFTDQEAGFYAAASLLGKIIFFGTVSITQVMFAKVSENYFNKKDFKKIMYNSLIIIGLVGLSAFAFYTLFSDIIINMFVGNQFLPIKPYIGKFAIIMTLFSLVYSLSFYNISINRKKFILFIISGNILEVLLIILFHNSIGQIVNILLGLVSVLFIILFIYTVFKKNDRIINSNTSI